MKTHSTKRRTAPRRGVLPHGAVRLGCERLEERAFLAGDVQFQNPANQFDVNGDGAVNRLDVFALISGLRSGGERSLVSTDTQTPGSDTQTPGTDTDVVPALSEGEAPGANSSGFVDVNGDNEFDRRDAFSLIGHLRSEGEDPPTGAPVVMRYTLGVFQEINGQIVQLTDPDGAGPLGITVPQNSNFLVRVFVEDLGADPPGVARDPNEFGIGQFALDLDYGAIGDNANITVVDNPVAASAVLTLNDTSTITVTAAVAGAAFNGVNVRFVDDNAIVPGQATAVYDDPNNRIDIHVNGNTAKAVIANAITALVDWNAVAGGGGVGFVEANDAAANATTASGANSNIAHFEGPENPSNPAINTPFDTPTGPFIPVYNDANPPRSGTNDTLEDRVRNISGQDITFPPFNGTNAILAFEVEFLSGPVGPGDSSVTIATTDFTGDPPNNTFFNATQDGAWFANPKTDPGNPFAILNSMVDDDTITITIVDDTFANPDVANLHELPAPPPNPLTLPVIAVDPGTDVLNGTISLDVLANDFFPSNPPGTSRAVTAVTQPPGGQGTTVINDNGTPADLRDDFIDYTPPNPFFVSSTPVTFTYTMTVLIPTPGGGFSPGASRTGTVTLDLREFNFAPVPSAPGVDEANDAIDGLDGTLDNTVTVRQGDSAVFSGNILLGNDLNGDEVDTTDPLAEVQTLHISGDPRPQFSPAPGFEPVVLVNGVVTPAAGTAFVDAAGNLVFQSDPGFVVDPTNGTVVTVRYFVEDEQLEQSLANGIQPLVVTPKRTVQELDITVTDRPDLAAVSVVFFDDVGGVPGVVPRTEVSVGASFFAVVTVDVTDAGVTDANATGVQNTIVDMLYDNLLVDTFGGPADAAQITVDATFNNPPTNAAIVPPNLVDNTGGTTVANADTNPQQVFIVRMQAGNPALSTDTDFVPLFADNQGTPSAVNVVLNVGLGTLVLDEAQIGFNTGTLLLAVGQRPIANPDFVYVTNEDVTLTVSDVNVYNGTDTGFDPAFGVLKNDSDTTDAAIPGNLIKAELLDISGIQNGVLLLEDPANPGTFITITTVADAPANWNGGFQFVPNPDFFHNPPATPATDFFLYHVIDSDLRRSDPARVDIRVDSVLDNPVGVDDTYAVGANPDVLTVDDEGNLTGQGGPAPEPPVRGVLNNDTDQDAGTTLTAVLISVPNFGTLELEDPANPGVFITINNVADAPVGWQGTFRYTPNPGVRGVVDTFLYRAVDNTGLESADTQVNIEIDLANVTVAGRVWVDAGTGVPSSTPFDGIFNFINNNATPEFDRGDLNIERTLGGVNMQLAGAAIVGGGAVVVNAETNSAGEFVITEQAPGLPIPAGNFNLTTDARLETFFNPPANANNIFVDRTAADAFFGERGLKLAFINPTDFFASTSRDGIYIGFDDSAVGGDPIVWYAIDRGPGWNVFDHEITGLEFVGGAARLSFTQENPLLPGVPDAFTVAVPVNNANHYLEIRDPVSGFRVIHIMGTADTLRAQFQV
jgi:hypothetical protein